MAGLPVKPEQHLDGVSLVPLLKGNGELQRTALYWHYQPGTTAEGQRRTTAHGTLLALSPLQQPGWFSWWSDSDR